MVVELRVVQVWSEIILVISNRTRAAPSFDFEITRVISYQIALYSVQLPLLSSNNLLMRLVRKLLYSFVLHGLYNSQNADSVFNLAMGRSFTSRDYFQVNLENAFEDFTR